MYAAKQLAENEFAGVINPSIEKRFHDFLPINIGILGRR
jgi:hypothetical protein